MSLRDLDVNYLDKLITTAPKVGTALGTTPEYVNPKTGEASTAWNSHRHKLWGRVGQILQAPVGLVESGVEGFSSTIGSAMAGQSLGDSIRGGASLQYNQTVGILTGKETHSFQEAFSDPIATQNLPEPLQKPVGAGLGLLADLTLDPSTYFGAGMLTQSGKMAQKMASISRNAQRMATTTDTISVARRAKTAIGLNSKLARDARAALAAGEPLELAKTAQQQVALGQRASFGFGFVGKKGVWTSDTVNRAFEASRAQFNDLLKSSVQRAWEASVGKTPLGTKLASGASRVSSSVKEGIKTRFSTKTGNQGADTVETMANNKIQYLVQESNKMAEAAAKNYNRLSTASKNKIAATLQGVLDEGKLTTEELDVYKEIDTYRRTLTKWRQNALVDPEEITNWLPRVQQPGEKKMSFITEDAHPSKVHGESQSTMPGRHIDTVVPVKNRSGMARKEVRDLNTMTKHLRVDEVRKIEEDVASKVKLLNARRAELARTINVPGSEDKAEYLKKLLEERRSATKTQPGVGPVITKAQEDAALAKLAGEKSASLDERITQALLRPKGEKTTAVRSSQAAQQTTLQRIAELDQLILDAENSVTGRVGELPNADVFYSSKVKKLAPGTLRTPEGTVVPDVPAGGKTPYDTPEIIAARERQAATPSTHLDTTPERAALRNKITDEMYGTGAKNKNRRVDIVMGPPGAGKSSLFADPLTKEHGSLLIDSDMIKAKLGPLELAGSLHQESSGLVDGSLLPRAMTAGDNIVYPIVGKTLSTLQEQIDIFKAKGYDIHLHYVDVPPEVSAQRVVARFMDAPVGKKRFVDPEYVLSVGNKPLENFEALKNQEGISSYERYTANVSRGDEPILLERGSGTTVDVRHRGLDDIADTGGRNTGTQRSGGNASNDGGGAGGDVYTDFYTRQTAPVEGFDGTQGVNDWIREKNKTLAPNQQIPLFETNPVVALQRRGMGIARAVSATEYVAGMKEFGKLAQDAPDNWLAVNLKGLEGMRFEPEIAKHIDATYKAWRPEELGVFMRMFKPMQDWWKAQALVAPSYHMRNFASNKWNNFLAGVNDPGVYKAALDIQRGKQIKPFIDDAGHAWTADDILEEALRNGVIGEGWYAKDIGSDVEKTLTQSLGNKLNPLNRENALFQANRSAGSAIENNDRLAHFIFKLREGDSPFDAAQSVKKYLFDYGELTPFEQKTMKSVFPFYTWTRKNVPLQIEEMMKQPGKFVGPYKAQNAIEANAGPAPDEQYMSEYIKNNVPIRIRTNEDGTTEYFLLGSWLPSASMMSFLSQSEDSLLGMLTPFLKVPLETIFNKSLFFKNQMGEMQDIEKTPGESTNFLGLTVRGKFANVMRNIRVLNELDKMNPGGIFGTKEHGAVIQFPGVDVPGLGPITPTEARTGLQKPEPTAGQKTGTFLLGRTASYNPTVEGVYSRQAQQEYITELQTTYKKELRRGNRKRAEMLRQKINAARKKMQSAN